MFSTTVKPPPSPPNREFRAITIPLLSILQTTKPSHPIRRARPVSIRRPTAPALLYILLVRGAPPLIVSGNRRCKGADASKHGRNAELEQRRQRRWRQPSGGSDVKVAAAVVAVAAATAAAGATAVCIFHAKSGGLGTPSIRSMKRVSWFSNSALFLLQVGSKQPSTHESRNEKPSPADGRCTQSIIMMIQDCTTRVDGRIAVAIATGRCTPPGLQNAQ